MQGEGRSTVTGGDLYHGSSGHRRRRVDSNRRLQLIGRQPVNALGDIRDQRGWATVIALRNICLKCDGVIKREMYNGCGAPKTLTFTDLNMSGMDWDIDVCDE